MSVYAVRHSTVEIQRKSESSGPMYCNTAGSCLRNESDNYSHKYVNIIIYRRLLPILPLQYISARDLVLTDLFNDSLVTGLL